MSQILETVVCKIEKVNVWPMENVKSVALIVDDSLLVQCQPEENGNVIFWKNFKIDPSNHKKVMILVEYTGNIAPKLTYNDQFVCIPYSEPIFIPSQTYCPNALVGTGYNNVFVVTHEGSGLKYVS